MSKRDEYLVVLLTAAEVRRLARHATILAGAVKVYGPQSQKRVQQAADWVLRKLTNFKGVA